MRFSPTGDHVSVPSFGIGVFPVNECHATKTIAERSDEIAVGQIAFQAHTLFALAAEQKQSGCPDRIKSVEPGRVFLDVGFHGKEVLADEFSSFLVLGFLPILYGMVYSFRCIGMIIAGRDTDDDFNEP